MKIRYSVVRTVIISVMAVFGIAAIVTLYAVAPTLHGIAKTRTQDYLRERFKSSVQFKDFDVTVYPSIHVVIHELVMRHQGRTDIPPLIDVTAIHLYADLASLFSHHPVISHVVLVGLQINTPPRYPGGPPMIKGSNVDLSKKFPVKIARITADQATITILRTDTKPPKQFEIHQLELKDFDFTNPAPFHAVLTNPVPRGEIHCDGQFGPWQADDPSQTPVAANYVFANADMGTLKGLKGTLNSEGHFSGPLDYLNVEGKTDIPDFALRTSDHPVALHTDFKAIVDGTNGNTYLKIVTAHFGHTTLVTKGEVVDEYKTVKGRTIVMDTVANDARIEDLLLLAVKSNPPVMTGSAKLKAKILIPEGTQDLIQRLRIDGQFGVAGAEFSSDSVQGKVDSLSRRAQGRPKDLDLTAVSELNATFKMGNSDINFSHLNFSVPGADIALLGDYNVDSGQLDFHGNLNMEAKLSQTMTGVKSFFLKAVDPFVFKGKNGYKTTLPIKVTGTKDHPAFGLDRHRDKGDKTDKADKADKNGNKDQALKTDDPKSAKTARE